MSLVSWIKFGVCAEGGGGCKSNYIKVAAVRVRVYSGPILMVHGTGAFSLPKPRPNREKTSTSYLESCSSLLAGDWRTSTGR